MAVRIIRRHKQHVVKTQYPLKKSRQQDWWMENRGNSQILEQSPGSGQGGFYWQNQDLEH